MPRYAVVFEERGPGLIPYVVVAASATLLAYLSVVVSRSLAAPAGQNIAVRRSRARRFWTPFDVLVVTLLVTFSALRYMVGTDYAMYSNYYARANPASDWAAQIDAFQQEALYTGLSLALKAGTDSPHAIFWLTSALTVIPVYAALRKQSRDLPFAVLLYILLAFYVAPFNTVRQGIAVAFLFWAYSFFTRRTLVVAALLATIACLFHTSAVIAVVVMLLARLWRPGPRATTVVFIVAAAVATSLWQIPALANLISGLSGRYAEYVATSEAAGFGTYMLAAAYVVFAILMLALRQYNDRTDWLAFLVMGAVFVIVGTQSLVAVRLFNYFGIFAILLVPNVLAARRGSTGIRIAITGGAAAYFMLYLANYGDLVPYQTYL